MARLPQELGTGMQVVGPEVPAMQELVGAKRPPLPHQFLRDLLHQFKISPRHLPRNRIGKLIHQDHFRPQGPHHAGPFT